MQHIMDAVFKHEEVIFSHFSCFQLSSLFVYYCWPYLQLNYVLKLIFENNIKTFKINNNIIRNYHILL